MQKRRIRRQVDFDEVISDSNPSVEKFSAIESPLNQSVFHMVFAVAVIMTLIFLGKTVFLAGVQGSHYANRSENNINQDVPLIAPRGIITDRNNIPLVENEAIFSVFLRINEMVRSNEQEEVLSVSETILGLNRDEVLENINSTNFEGAVDVILARDITRDQVIAIRGLGLTSLVVENDYRRRYNSKAFSHVIGYVGLANSKDLNSNEDLVINDLVGRAGLEAYYDSRLRGKNGAVTIYRNALGDVEAIERTREPIAGDKLETTIDAKFQEYFYNRMLKGLTSLNRTSGVGMAINPQNGEVLALISFPSFDANNISPSLSNPHQPLFNRAISGLYSPGSTIKPIHATAALAEGNVTPTDQVFSPRYIEIPNPYNPDHPSRFVDWKPQGWVDVKSALARSSNVYFYAIGGGFEDTKGLGIAKLREYWDIFGINKLTGIDLPGESKGILPDPDEKKERTGSIWRIGDTYNVSIGQGDLRITPIELLISIAAIANHGKAFIPHIAKIDNPQPLLDLGWLESSLSIVREGMIDAVDKPYGTANMLKDLPMSTAAKTGSSQVANNTKTNALFVGYGPTENPEIAIIILVEDAKEGSLNAVPIANDVLRWYYKNRLIN